MSGHGAGQQGRGAWSVQTRGAPIRGTSWLSFNFLPPQSSTWGGQIQKNDHQETKKKLSQERGVHIQDKQPSDLGACQEDVLWGPQAFSQDPGPVTVPGILPAPAKPQRIQQTLSGAAPVGAPGHSHTSSGIQ